ncbi:MAG: choice-of-anchor Q domain-containing protein [Planctomycetota bacterium]
MRQTTPTRRKATRNRLIENLETRRLLATFTVDTISDVTDELDGLTTLREAVLEAEASPGADEIVFDPTVFATPQTITLAEGQIIIGTDFAASDLTITDSAAGVTLDANDASRHFGIDGDTTDDGMADLVSSLTLNGLVLTNGNIAADLTDPLNPTRGSGGSVFVENLATFVANGTSFIDNEAGDGGAVISIGNTTLNDVTATGNVASDPDSGSSGGAIFGSAGTLTINGGTYTNNLAAENPSGAGGGGAIRAFTQTTVTDAVITGNNANFGGGFMIQAAPATLTNVTLTGNTVTTSGGGAYLDPVDGPEGGEFFTGQIIVDGSTFDDNTATFGGGFIYFGLDAPLPARMGPSANPAPVTPAGPLATVTTSENRNDFVDLEARGVRDTSIGLERDTSLSATSQFGRDPIGDLGLVVTGTTISNNTASSLGGGVLADSGSVSFDNTRFVDNEVLGAVGDGGSGGGLWAADTELLITNSEFSGNSAVNQTAPVDPDTFGPDYGFGGALEVQISTTDPAVGFGADVYNVTIVQSTFSGNTSDARAGMSFSAFGDTGATVDPAFAISITQSTVVFNDGLDSAIVIQPTDTFLDDASSFTIVNSFLAGNTGFTDDDGDPLTPQVQEPANFGTTAALPGGSTFGVGETASNTILGTDITFDFDGDELTPATPAGFATDSPALAPLATNGGFTQNHLPLPGSDAIDNGAPALAVNPGPDNVAGDDPDTPADESLDDIALVFDQRGAPFDRVFDDPMVVDDFVDIGAVELSAAPPEVVTSSYDAAFLEVVFEFDQDVSASLTGADLIVTNQTTNTQIDSTTATVGFDMLTNTATFSLVPLVQGSLLTNGNYEFSLDTAGVANSGGATLVSSPFIEDFFLAGDADRSRSVNLADFGILRSNFGGTPVDGFLSADFNLDGSVNLADFGILRANFGQSVAAPADSLFSDDEL